MRLIEYKIQGTAEYVPPWSASLFSNRSKNLSLKLLWINIIITIITKIIIIIIIIVIITNVIIIIIIII